MAHKNFAENQGNASNADLQYNAPLDYAEGRFSGGIEQSTASEAAISQTPWDTMPMNVGAENGSKQITASEAPLSSAPMHGWQSYPTPPSVRAVKQSK